MGQVGGERDLESFLYIGEVDWSWARIGCGGAALALVGLILAKIIGVFFLFRLVLFSIRSLLLYCFKFSPLISFGNGIPYSSV
jgi:hypothetical protein